MGVVMAGDTQRAARHRRRDLIRVPSPRATTPLLSAPLPHERRLYEAQRAAFHGTVDADRPITANEVVALARRVGLDEISVTIDNAGLEPLDAVAIPSTRALRFHRDSLTLWIAIHEVTHLLFPAETGHGRRFVSTMLYIVGDECGRRCSDRFRTQLLRHAVPMLAASNNAGVFVLRSNDRFVAMTRRRIVEGPAPKATRLTTLAAAERAARLAQDKLRTAVEIVQLA